ncbi:c-type cytochrome [Bathymodiolus septemdierum thioautotrophic gill symbiont]|uniref:Cytochrome c, class I n=1 Tax=endosymbiont of Bathymodiolus septemdierum str. Myojin knoll TaxID=1303921 RepID=A0A0N7KB92_9GAMM|nr:cytochrome c [Bathymodiolus septemdierum thioautotrophic gill symbiont]BAS67367.1 cytochrome c, class I [endosymbiont of Bathymodiolus septemdierum str. Myojin knoll]
MKKKIAIVSSVLFLAGCFDSGDAEAKNVALGKVVFDKNCASCHGKAAVGLTKNWKQVLPNGKYPAPPLNGSAHAWHHSPKLLLSTINNGGAKLGGWMPGFKGKLSEDEKQAILDYLHSLWPKDIQQKYDARFK